MFTANCLPVLIGSLPLKDHTEAMQAILSSTPEIPLWPQLPKLPGEGMVRQFLTGYPGLQENAERFWVDTAAEDFSAQMAAFYEEYMEVLENPGSLTDSRFALTEETAHGFATYIQAIENRTQIIYALKGQVTGPVTAGVGLKDHHGRSIFYDENLRDILVKHLTLKACYQVAMMQSFHPQTQPIIFIDEPAIVSFGSTGFMGVTKEMATDAITEVVGGIQKSGSLAGVHICANGDWEPALSSAADIISFDAYFYFDNFILYKEPLIRFIDRGGILAWGIVPTGDAEILARTDTKTLFSKWQKQLDIITSFGFSHEKIMRQTFISPSCGTGSLSTELALKVLSLTAEISKYAQLLLHKVSTDTC